MKDLFKEAYLHWLYIVHDESLLQMYAAVVTAVLTTPGV